MIRSIKTKILDTKSLERYFYYLTRYCLLLIVLVIIGYEANCQSLKNNFEKLTTNSGLSNNTVYAIIEDDLGFIWAGTKNGLNRYDGYNFKTFSLPDVNYTGNNHPTIYSLLIDSKKIIWIGLKDGGLIAYDKTNHLFRRFPFENNSTVDWSTITIKTIFEDSRKWLWIGTYGGGTIVLDENRSVIFHFCTYCDKVRKEQLSNDFVFDFVEDPDNHNIYIATAGKGLNIFDMQSKSIQDIHAIDDKDMNSFSKTLCLDKDKTLWIGTEGNGLYAYNLIDKSWKSYQANTTSNSINNDIITDIELDKKGQLWLATDGGGLNQFSSETNQFHHYKYTTTHPNSLNTDALYDLHFDHSGNLWIGTFNGGINILKSIQSPFYSNRQYELEKKQGLRSILSVQQDKNGHVWLGTDGGGLFYFAINDQNLTLRDASHLLNEGAFNQVITCIESNADHGLWYGSFANGLYYFDFQKGSIQQFVHDDNKPGSLIHNNVWDIEMDMNGGLWIGTLGGGVDYLPKGETTFQHLNNQNNQFSDVQIIDIHLDKKNDFLWIATESNGLKRLNIATKKIDKYQFGQEGGISSNNLQTLFEDKAGNIWIVTDIGLDKLNPKTNHIHQFDFDHQFSIGTINSIEEDETGFIWLTTSTGIHRLSTLKNTIIELGVEPALGNNSYNPKAALRLSNGHIFFGGVNGFSIVNPRELQLNNNIARPVFTNFKISNKPVEPGDYKGRTILNKSLNDDDVVVRLSYQDKGIAFEFSATEFTDPRLNKYAYKLEGFDEQWNYADANQRNIFYSSLDGGKYRLHLKAANSSGVWNKNVRTIDVIVEPPFWETAWFYILMITLILSGILLIYRFLLNRQKEIYELKALEQEQYILKKEQEILRLQNENLEEEITNKKAELNASILQIAHKNEFLTILKGRIKKIKADADENAAKPLRSVINIINNELRQEDYWEQFQLIFNQTFQDFIKQIGLRYPNLTANDHRLCCFIKMKLNNREIASILNITLSAVEQAKYRLKKKIGLNKHENLNEYLQQYGA